jgi:23S rRNA pseudouridine2605 synthase
MTGPGRGGELRLQVYLARCGIASRRKCEEFIAEGRVRLNGQTVTEAGTKVGEKDEVLFDGKRVFPEKRWIYLVLNKPAGYLCTNSDPEDRPLAIDLLKGEFRERLFYVGRLDYLSEGLIFFTNHGDFAMKVSHPSAEIEKEYRIDTHDQVDEEVLRTYMRGVTIEGIRYRIKSYKKIDPYRISLTLVEGKNREIRRLLKNSEIGIKRLVRVRIGPVKLEGLKTGNYRFLTTDEISWFLKDKKDDSSD